jgi:hypothetical protein
MLLSFFMEMNSIFLQLVLSASKVLNHCLSYYQSKNKLLIFRSTFPKPMRTIIISLRIAFGESYREERRQSV